MHKTLTDIIARKIVKMPLYDFKSNARLKDKYAIVHASDVHVVLFEGILAFYDKRIRDLFNMKCFVDTDPDTRLERRVRKDTLEMNRDLELVLNQYITFVKPSFEDFCLPTKKYADVIIPRGAENTVAIDLIVQHIQDLIRGPQPADKNRLRNRARHHSDSMVSRPH
ncbi:PREDICTED: uridine-cytidine kinase 2-B-like isoform X2 [Priapulus caudatus]|nr:PREDICTED: uridine-cytidine kinase 2-B-like isoform X2 [Priapulus caudatus]